MVEGGRGGRRRESGRGRGCRGRGGRGREGEVVDGRRVVYIKVPHNEKDRQFFQTAFSCCNV